MEPFYYSKMNKMQQAAYHAICQGVLQMEKEIQVPRMSGEEFSFCRNICLTGRR